ncbi:hypothetical protein [Shimia sagamensis]|uniref:Membrane-bound lysozyme-inhibitor of c-type lysozyme n=1 Tax=Shimia sagamensis TaxID=1566352 RepID=A0ABY1PDG9_9RHOB|nr:hypothetical protein [Shimia sagamensis]SMP31759.1 hypothetical protein SAMN06265373_10864 [Shimia sagamensis]
MKTPAILLTFALSTAPHFALAEATLLGADTAHAALSGVHYTCDLGEMKFDMIFKNVPANAKAFPYEFKAGERTSEDAYILTDTGEIHLQSAKEARFLTVDKGILGIAKTPDGRAASCKAM